MNEAEPPPACVFDRAGLEDLLTWIQDGVVSRRQLIDLGATDNDIRRMVRRRELKRQVSGVFVNHTGPLSRAQREWVAVLAHWPAVLTRESALTHLPPRAVIHVAVDEGRTVRPVPGVRAHRTAGLASRADWRKSPPRMRFVHAVLDVASTLSDDVWATYQFLADAVQTRESTASELQDALTGRRLAGSRLLHELLDDLATGACSVLEREYLRRVERAHGLPIGRRQKPSNAGGRRAARDVAYEDFDLLVELDGRAFHDNAKARDDDADRDLDARVDEGLSTVRLTFGLVSGSACRTARRIGLLLQRGGWTGNVGTCPDCDGSGRDSQSPGD